MSPALFGGMNGGVNFWVASISTLFVTAFSIAGGIGGGGLLVPLYSVVLGLGPKASVPVSLAAISGTAISNLAFVARDRHPSRARPLIDYTTAVSMQAGVFGGVICGVFLNLILPELVIVVVLAVVLGYIPAPNTLANTPTLTLAPAQRPSPAYTLPPKPLPGYNAVKTIRKGAARWKQESASRGDGTAEPLVDEGDVHGDVQDDPAEKDPAMLCVLERVTSSDAMYPPVPEVEPSQGVQPQQTQPEVLQKTERAVEPSQAVQPQQVQTQHDALQQELAALYESESAQFSCRYYLELSLLSALVVLHALNASGALAFGLNSCHAAYWGLYWAPVLIFLVAVGLLARRNHRGHERKSALGYVFAEGDIPWTARICAVLSVASVGAGVMSGMLGIGGGMIMGPIFLDLRGQPEVVAATTSFMLVFTSLSGATEFLLLGSLGWQDLLWYGALGALGAQVGRRVVKVAVSRSGRPSIIVLCLGGIIGLAVVLMTTLGVLKVVADVQDGRSLWDFSLGMFLCNSTANGTSDNTANSTTP